MTIEEELELVKKQLKAQQEANIALADALKEAKENTVSWNDLSISGSSNYFTQWENPTYTTISNSKYANYNTSLNIDDNLPEAIQSDSSE